MKATFLEAKVPLTKMFEMHGDELRKISHPLVVNYVSHVEEFETIDEFADLMRTHGEKGHCLLKGNMTRDLLWESRAGTTSPTDPTSLMCFDLDGLRMTNDPQEFMSAAKHGNVDYILQYSASSGIVADSGLRAHLFMLLDEPMSPPLLKQYLLHLNLTIPGLRQGINLTRTNNALRWPLDVSTCQNDKLIYIAPPILGKGLEDKFEGKRIQVVTRDVRVATLDMKGVSTSRNQQEQEKVLNELRLAAGLPARKKTMFARENGIEYMKAPDSAVVTGVRAQGNFVKLNLNGGDSWGYWHPLNNAKFIHSYKGEPSYRTEDLDPAYWSQTQRDVAIPKADERGRMFLAFREFKSAAYWNGTYDVDTDFLDLAQAKNENQLKHYLRSNGQASQDTIHDWRMEFTPERDKRVYPEEKLVNLYIPPDFARRKLEVVTELPPLSKELLCHVMNVKPDDEFLDHFVNWFAVIAQKKVLTKTAMVWHGIQGTGKGLTKDALLTPCLGISNMTSKTVDDIDDRFNAWVENCLLLWVDESSTGASISPERMEALVKNFVTETRISVRAMYRMHYDIDNRMSMIFASNKPDPVKIEPSDRRFNVANFQPQALPWSPEKIELLKAESWQFYCYIMQYKADVNRANKAINSEAKQKMIGTSMSSVEHVVAAIKDGDYQFFVEQLPVDGIDKLPGGKHERAKNYERALETIQKQKAISREDLIVIFDYIVGGMSSAPGKFSQFMAHRGLPLDTVWRGDKSVRGVKVQWKAASPALGVASPSSEKGPAGSSEGSETPEE